MNIFKIINIIGLVLWTVIFFLLISKKIIKEYPLVLIGYIYTCFILIINYIVIGNDNSDNKEDDFKNNIIGVTNIINNKAIQVSSATFAISLATKHIFKIDIYKHILQYMIFTLIFGVGFIIPIYFVSNVSPDTLLKYNEYILRIKNILLSYSIGFMVCTFMLIVSRVVKL